MSLTYSEIINHEKSRYFNTAIFVSLLSPEKGYYPDKVIAMVKLETIPLTESTLEEIGKKIQSFCSSDDLPVCIYEDTYINTTLEDVLNFEHDRKNHCQTKRIETLLVEFGKDGDSLQVTFSVKRPNQPDSYEIYWFPFGTEFVFNDEIFYVKVTCRDYVTNKNDYVIKIFQLRP